MAGAVILTCFFPFTVSVICTSRILGRNSRRDASFERPSGADDRDEPGQHNLALPQVRHAQQARHPHLHGVRQRRAEPLHLQELMQHGGGRFSSVCRFVFSKRCIQMACFYILCNSQLHDIKKTLPRTNIPSSVFMSAQGSTHSPARSFLAYFFSAPSAPVIRTAPEITASRIRMKERMNGTPSAPMVDVPPKISTRSSMRKLISVTR